MEKEINLKIINSVIIILFLTLIITNLYVNLAYFVFPVDILGVESNVIYSIQTIRESNSTLYNDPSRIPYSITQYSPFYYIINDGLNHLLNIPFNDHYNIRIIARSVSALIFLFSLCLLFLFLKKDLRSGYSQAFFITSSYFIFTSPWFITVRPDVMLFLCYISGIILFYNYTKKEKLIFLILFSFVSTVAIFSKQNGIIPIVVLMIYLLSERKFKEIFISGSFLLIFSSLFVFLMMKSNYISESIFVNIIKGVDNGINPSWALSMAYLPFTIHFGILLIALVLITILFYQKLSLNDKFLKLLFIFSTTQFIFTTTAALKRGSAINYYFELLLLISILFMILIIKISDKGINLKIILNTLLLMAALSITANNLSRYINRVSSYNIENPDQIFHNIKNFLTENLNKDEYFFAPIREINIMFPKQCIIPQYDIFDCCSFPRKTYNYDSLCNDFSDGKIKVIILYEVLRDNYNCNLTDHYRFVEQIDGLNVYLFRYQGEVIMKEFSTFEPRIQGL